MTTHQQEYRGFVPEPSGRGTIGLFWSCVLTLITCLWTSLHLNVPPPGYTPSQILRRKLKWVLFGAIAPEILVVRAFEQYRRVQEEVNELNSLPEMIGCNNKWTLTDGFNANMGGLLLSTPECEPFLVDTKMIISLVKKKRIPPPVSMRKAIFDKSKADAVGKLLSCVQAFWLIVQSIARASQRLSISLLELTTIAYVFCAIMIYILLWHKPLDVCIPSTFVVETIHLNPINIRDSIHTTSDVQIITGGSNLPDAPSHPRRPIDQNDVSPFDGFSESTFQWIGLRAISGPFSIRAITKLRYTWPWYNPVLWTTTIYGGGQFLAWNFFFPTAVELRLWRVGAVTSVVLVVVFFGLVKMVMPIFNWRKRHFDVLDFSSWNYRLSTGVLTGIFWILAIIYLVYGLTRLIMIIQVFAALRRLPADVFETVQWTVFLPHL